MPSIFTNNNNTLKVGVSIDTTIHSSRVKTLYNDYLTVKLILFTKKTAPDKTLPMKWFLNSLLLCITAFAHAETPLSRSLISGNAVVNTDSIQKIVKELIVQNLQKNYTAESKFGGISIQTKASEHSLRIPAEKPLLKDILSTLGISNQLQVLIDPIQTSINFNPDSLKVKIEKTGTNLFKIRAHWEIQELQAESKALKIAVPKGVFDEAFVISSNPVQISLKQGSGPVTADLTMSAELTTDGSKISLESFETNLQDETPRLQVKLGTLNINGAPLELEIQSNGQSITTSEPVIRAQFQNFEPQLMKNVQKQLGTLIQTQFTQLSEKLSKEEPFKISFNSNDVLSKYSFSNAAISALFKNIDASFMFSYLQELPKQNLFSAQVSSQVCVGQKCLSNFWGTSAITVEDISELQNSDGGVILYESWVQNVINSAAFQKRIASFYQKSLKTPGISLGKEGAKVHFNPKNNSITAVVNLKIDIKSTGNPSNALTSWSGLKDYTKKQLADLWENIAGSGQYVRLPVEIAGKIKGVQLDSQNRRVLVIKPEILINNDGTITNTFGYESNVENMSGATRRAVLASVKKEFGKSLPSKIEIPLDDAIQLAGIKFSVNQVFITPNKGLLISGCIK